VFSFLEGGRSIALRIKVLESILVSQPISAREWQNEELAEDDLSL